MECKQCGMIKAASDFYVSNKSKCKECIKIAVKENRLANIEHYRAYDQRRANNPDRSHARDAYQSTQQGRIASNKAKKAYIDRNAYKRSAHIRLGNAVKAGKVKPLPCEVCGAEKTEAHHSAYDLPLVVTWLCHKHHQMLHRQFRGIFKNGSF